MENDASNNIGSPWIIEIPIENKEYLGQIRHWSNLKISLNEGFFYIKDVTFEQLNSKDLLSIQNTKIYIEKDNLLFLKNSLLPLKKMPSGLLWTPISRFIFVELPTLNHNFFGINETIDIKIISSNIEKQSFAILTSKEIVSNYIQTAPKVRLQNLKWVIVNNEILIIGTPILPIQGATFWLLNDFLIPTGFDFEFSILSELLQEKMNFDKENFIFWTQDNTHFKIAKELFQDLSISSFRLTFDIS